MDTPELTSITHVWKSAVEAPWFLLLYSLLTCGLDTTAVLGAHWNFTGWTFPTRFAIALVEGFIAASVSRAILWPARTPMDIALWPFVARIEVTLTLACVSAVAMVRTLMVTAKAGDTGKVTLAKAGTWISTIDTL